MSLSDNVCAEGVDALTLNEDDRTPSTPASEAKEVEDIDDGDVVDPWNVESKSETGVDYDKLISTCVLDVFPKHENNPKFSF